MIVLTKWSSKQYVYVVGRHTHNIYNNNNKCIDLNGERRMSDPEIAHTHTLRNVLSDFTCLCVYARKTKCGHCRRIKYGGGRKYKK